MLGKSPSVRARPSTRTHHERHLFCLLDDVVETVATLRTSNFSPLSFLLTVVHTLRLVTLAHILEVVTHLLLKTWTQSIHYNPH